MGMRARRFGIGGIPLSIDRTDEYLLCRFCRFPLSDHVCIGDVVRYDRNGKIVCRIKSSVRDANLGEYKAQRGRELKADLDRYQAGLDSRCGKVRKL